MRGRGGAGARGRGGPGSRWRWGARAQERGRNGATPSTILPPHLPPPRPPRPKRPPRPCARVARTPCAHPSAPTPPAPAPPRPHTPPPRHPRPGAVRCWARRDESGRSGAGMINGCAGGAIEIGSFGFLPVDAGGVGSPLRSKSQCGIQASSLASPKADSIVEPGAPPQNQS